MKPNKLKNSILCVTAAISITTNHCMDTAYDAIANPWIVGTATVTAAAVGTAYAYKWYTTPNKQNPWATTNARYNFTPTKPYDPNQLFGQYETQGPRPSMEDACTVIPAVEGNPKRSLYAIFDGHGGEQAASYAARHICSTFLQELKKENTIEQALKLSFLTIDKEFLATNNDRTGTTAVVAYIDNNMLHCAWAGDSRAVVADSNDKVIFATEDHKPDSTTEKARIEAAGGFITPESQESVARLGGLLAVSRALGNKLIRDHKQGKGLIPDPAYKSTKLQQGDMLILACDGLWDVTSNETAARAAQAKNRSLDDSAELLAQTALKNGSVDNISILLVPIKLEAPAPNPADAAHA